MHSLSFEDVTKEQIKLGYKEAEYCFDIIKEFKSKYKKFDYLFEKDLLFEPKAGKWNCVFSKKGVVPVHVNALYRFHDISYNEMKEYCNLVKESFDKNDSHINNGIIWIINTNDNLKYLSESAYQKYVKLYPSYEEYLNSLTSKQRYIIKHKLKINTCKFELTKSIDTEFLDFYFSQSDKHSTINKDNFLFDAYEMIYSCALSLSGKDVYFIKVTDTNDNIVGYFSFYVNNRYVYYIAGASSFPNVGTLALNYAVNNFCGKYDYIDLYCLPDVKFGVYDPAYNYKSPLLNSKYPINVLSVVYKDIGLELSKPYVDFIDNYKEIL